jgi:hypothetical protein
MPKASFSEEMSPNGIAIRFGQKKASSQGRGLIFLSR